VINELTGHFWSGLVRPALIVRARRADVRKQSVM
jgi:hypothetical protein